MKNFWELGKWRGLPVSMHWTVLLWLPWLFLFMRDVVSALIAFPAVCLLFVAHEAGHVILARRRKVFVQRIELWGLHGQTVRAEARNAMDEAVIAWGGVLAQLVVLAAALAVNYLVPLPPWSWIVAGPVLMVLINWNIFFILVALLPIGPMDGHAAWKILKLMRRRAARPKVASTPPRPPAEPQWTAEELRAMEERSEQVAQDLLRHLGKKGDAGAPKGEDPSRGANRN